MWEAGEIYYNIFNATGMCIELFAYPGINNAILYFSNDTASLKYTLMTDNLLDNITMVVGTWVNGTTSTAFTSSSFGLSYCSFAQSASLSFVSLLALISYYFL